MSARNRFGTAAAIALMTTVGAVLLSACGPENTDTGPSAAPTGAAPGSTVPGSAAPGSAAPGSPSRSGSPAPGGKVVNGTSAANHLTISTGARITAPGSR